MPTGRRYARYDKVYAHCDVLVVGGGPAWLAATPAEPLARVMLVDEDPNPVARC